MNNPLLKENPACLGGFLSEIIAKAAVPVVAPKQDEHPPLEMDATVDTPKALPSPRKIVEPPGPETEEKVPEPAQEPPKPAYTAYWSQFKRQPSKQEVVEVPVVEAKMPEAAAAVSEPSAVPVVEVEDGPENLSSHEREVMDFVDNQLGDPTLYPPDALGDLQQLDSVEGTLMDSSPGATCPQRHRSSHQRQKM